jgi:hypothetical protein
VQDGCLVLRVQDACGLKGSPSTECHAHGGMRWHCDLLLVKARCMRDEYEGAGHNRRADAAMQGPQNPEILLHFLDKNSNFSKNQVFSPQWRTIDK